jgi:hypothetical protein
MKSILRVYTDLGMDDGHVVHGFFLNTQEALKCAEKWYARDGVIIEECPIGDWDTYGNNEVLPTRLLEASECREYVGVLNDDTIIKSYILKGPLVSFFTIPEAWKTVPAHPGNSIP